MRHTLLTVISNLIVNISSNSSNDNADLAVFIDVGWLGYLDSSASLPTTADGLGPTTHLCSLASSVQALPQHCQWSYWRVG
jgi:hypothetical protein